MRPVSVFILWFLVGFQAISGLGGGITLLADPSGELMKMPASMMQGGIFHSFLIPGICLTVLLGIFPTVALYGLIRRRPFALGMLNIYRDRHWGWAYALYTGIMLMIWILTEMYIIQAVALLHVIYGMLGVVIIIACLIPGTMRYYEK